MYQIKEVTSEDYEQFNKGIETYSLFQTSAFTESRKINYADAKLLGFYLDEVLVGTTQILIENIPVIKKKMGTSIKGVNIDFSNEKLLKAFQVEMKKYLKKNNFLLFRFDIPIAYQIMNANFEILNDETLKEDNFTFPYDKDIKNKLHKAGFEEFFIDENYMGRSPQYSMLVDTKSEESTNKHLNRSAKRAIKLANEHGVDFQVITNPLEESVDGQCYIEIFYDLHQQNADINNISILPIEYYKELFKNNENLKLFLVSVDNDKFLEITKANLEKKENKKNLNLFHLALSKSETTNDLQEKNKRTYIIGHISGFYNKVGYDLFTGLDYDFRDLGAKEALMKFIFNYATENKIDYYDFWGILGRLDDNDPMMPIYNFKKKFSDYVVQYPGFWDIQTNRVLYTLLKLRTKKNYLKKH